MSGGSARERKCGRDARVPRSACDEVRLAKIPRRAHASTTPVAALRAMGPSATGADSSPAGPARRRRTQGRPRGACLAKTPPRTCPEEGEAALIRRCGVDYNSREVMARGQAHPGRAFPRGGRPGPGRRRPTRPAARPSFPVIGPRRRRRRSGGRGRRSSEPVPAARPACPADPPGRRRRQRAAFRANGSAERTGRRRSRRSSACAGRRRKTSGTMQTGETGT